MSTNVGRGSRPVSGHGSVRDSAAGRLGGNPVRGSVTGDVRSGPVSDSSVGSVRTQLPPAIAVVPPPEYFPEGSDEIPRDDTGAPANDLPALADRLRQIEPLPLNPESSEPTPETEGEPEEAAAPIEDEEPPPAEDDAEDAAEPSDDGGSDESAAEPEPPVAEAETEAAATPEPQ